MYLVASISIEFPFELTNILSIVGNHYIFYKKLGFHARFYIEIHMFYICIRVVGQIFSIYKKF